jgi:uncharacterized protein (TIGR02453 family)
MLQASTLGFLNGLAEHNDKTWFDANRPAYEAAKKDYEHLVDRLRVALVPIVPQLAEQRPKDLVFRIFRDVRFSKDKTPYKTNFGSYYCRAGKKAPDAGFYLHLEPGGKSFLGAGLWMPEGPLLKAVRQEIDYDFDNFQAILNAPAFRKHFKKMEGERLKTLPQGYGLDNPAIEYLKYKSYIMTTPLTDELWMQPDAVKKIAALCVTANEWVAFLNRAMDA